MLEDAIATYGDGSVGAACGLLLGIAFGLAAQRSRFCMRSAVVEAAQNRPGEKLSMWLLAVGIAIAATQGLMALGYVNAETIRPLNGRGSISGAAIGGLLFGAGMILSRGCVSRLLVLSAGGNLRALITGLIFVCTAMATMRGMLGLGRDPLTALASVEGAINLNLLSRLGLGAWAGVAAGVVVILFALRMGLRGNHPRGNLLLAGIIGLLVAATYGLTAALNGASFDPAPVRGLSFIAPSVTVLGTVLLQNAIKLDFDLGLIPGVFLGAMIAGAWAREWKLEGFNSGEHMRRYIFGALLMGFGGVVATGCSMGNGVSGSAIFSTTAIVALAAMWIGAMTTDYLVDRRTAAQQAPLESGVASLKS